jgi:hypothetical protein
MINLFKQNIIIFQASYWKGNASRKSMYAYMEHQCGSTRNSHLTNGSDKLLRLLKRAFPGKSSSRSPHTHWTNTGQSTVRRPADLRSRNIKSRQFLLHFYTDLLVVVLFSLFCEIQIRLVVYYDLPQHLSLTYSLTFCDSAVHHFIYALGK